MFAFTKIFSGRQQQLLKKLEKGLKIENKGE